VQQLALPAVIFGIGLCWLLLRLPSSLGIHDNTVTDLIQARHCLEEGICTTAGQRTTFGGLPQGGVWPAWLLLCLRAGLDIDGVAAANAVLTALAAAIVAWLAARRRGAVAGILAAIIYIASIQVSRTVLDIQWNPSLLPLPAALFLAAMFFHFESRDWRWTAAAGLLGALLCQTHLIGGVLCLVAFACVLLVPPKRPLLAAGSAGLAIVSSILFLSRDAVMQAWSLLSAGSLGEGATTVFRQQSGPIALLVTTVAISLLGSWLGRHEQRETGERALYLLVGSAAALLLGFSVSGDVALVPHYMVAFLPGFALVVAWTMVRPVEEPDGGPACVPLFHGILRGAAASLSLAITIVCGLMNPVLPGTEHSFADARSLANELPRWGIHNLHEAACRLRAPQRFHLLSGLSLELPQGDLGQPCDRGERELFVLHSALTRPESLPAGWEVLPSGDRWLWLIPRNAHVDWFTAMRIESDGVTTIGPALDPDCSTPGMPVVHGMCDAPLGGLGRLRLPAAALDLSTMKVRTVVGAHRSNTDVRSTKAEGYLEVSWEAGIEGRFDFMALPLVVLLAPEESLLGEVLGTP